MIRKKLETIGVVGLGLMGSSIIVSFLKSGYEVVGIAPLDGELKTGEERILEQLNLCMEMGLLLGSKTSYIDRLIVSDDYAKLTTCDLVVECIIELEEIKKLIYKKIEQYVSKDCIIASNTSAIPINILQQYIAFPSRFMGIHWAEPAYATRFLEITCGKDTSVELAEFVQKEAIDWQKEPTLLYKDIRGFITNRLMYAVYRQGFELINSGVVDMPGLDKCFQYDIGSWITLMGIFKRMDFDGLDNYRKTYSLIFPKLSNAKEIPEQMQRILEDQGRGIHNLKGLYLHSAASAKNLEEKFAVFNKEIYRLADHYRTKLKALNLGDTNG